MDILKYFALVTGIGTLVIGILFFVWYFGCDLLKGFYADENGKSKNWPLIPLAIVIIIAFPLMSYVVHLFDIKYPESPIEITTQIYNNNEELRELTYQINLLKNALNNPKKLTIEQIEDVLSNSLTYTEKMKILLFQNDSIISLLKDEIELERQNAEKSRQIAENLRSLTKEQIETVKFIITEDAKEASKNSFINGILFSIPIGFLMSFLSSFVFRKWSGKVKNSIYKKQIDDSNL